MAKTGVGPGRSTLVKVLGSIAELGVQGQSEAYRSLAFITDRLLGPYSILHI